MYLGQYNSEWAEAVAKEALHSNRRVSNCVQKLVDALADHRDMIDKLRRENARLQRMLDIQGVKQDGSPFAVIEGGREDE